MSREAQAREWWEAQDGEPSLHAKPEAFDAFDAKIVANLTALLDAVAEEGRKRGIQAAEGAIADNCYCDAWFGSKAPNAHELDCEVCRGAIAAIRAVHALAKGKP